jgi:pSer/pThr/pTyr-binding forkhead associated (FHA) protein
VADVYCNNCGHKNPLGSNFCSSCGAVLETESADHTTITFPPTQPGDPVDDEVSLNLDEVPTDVGVLVVKRGPKAGTRFPLVEEVTTAGRHPDSTIFLDDITVSRRHAEIVRRGEGYVVRDAGSLNGTYVNRERIDERPLQNGDEVQVGKFKLVFFVGSAQEQ